MGCDIHVYQEMRKKDSIDKSWRSVSSRLNPGRNYYLFGLMANVRCQPESGKDPKGLPNDVGFCALNDNHIFISDNESDNSCTLEKAKQWEKDGSKIYYDKSGKAQFVDSPDNHSHSWLSYDEFVSVMEVFRNDRQLGYEDYIEYEYEALLASMTKLEELGMKTRIVFWFDN